MNKTNLQPLIDIMATLRDPENGCPWDLKQSHQTLVNMTFAEVSELADAIARDDADNICEELGDVLFHLVFYARLAEENGDFSMQTVIDTVTEKMTRRHPHIFAGKVYADEAEQHADWARIKAEEKGEKTTPYPQLDKANHSDKLPAIYQSLSMQKDLAKLGFDWFDAHAVFDKIHEEIDELKDELQAAALTKSDNHRAIAEEYGDCLFALINLGRKLNLDADMALRQANHKFYARSEAMVGKAGGAAAFAELSMAEKEALWQQVKANQ